MEERHLDRLDLGILYLLQSDARHNTTQAIGDRIGLSASAVGMRIRNLEDEGVIKGYHPTVDYEKTGFEHHILVTGTAPFEERDEVVERIEGVTGVANIRKMLTDEQNIVVEIIGRTRPELKESIYGLHETGMSVEEVNIIEDEIIQPFDHVGKDVTSSE